jgi:hypothetical protein
MPNNKENEFFDINKFPAQEGMLVFGISMSSISTKQSAERCFKYIEHMVQKIELPYVGLTFLYSDNLYLYQKGDYAKLNKKFQSLMTSHKNNFTKILDKNKWYIRDSFGFITWNQAILYSKKFMTYFGEIKKLYKENKEFNFYVKQDIKAMKRNPTKENVLFILEEILMFYLIAKGEIKFPNNYLHGKEKWTLFCYPGPPLKSETYLFQKNFFKLKNSKNYYENSYYDLEKKKLYKYDKINLKTIKF